MNQHPVRYVNLTTFLGEKIFLPEVIGDLGRMGIDMSISVKSIQRNATETVRGDYRDAPSSPYNIVAVRQHEILNDDELGKFTHHDFLKKALTRGLTPCNLAPGLREAYNLSRRYVRGDAHNAPPPYVVCSAVAAENNLRWPIITIPRPHSLSGASRGDMILFDLSLEGSKIPHMVKEGNVTFIMGRPKE